METWAFIKLVLTIVAPILGLGVGVWMNKRKTDLIHEEMEHVDAAILQHLTNDPAGLAELSRTLERLHREARRKTGHS